MATIYELQEELRREKGLAKNREELEKIGHERHKLEQEIKELKFKRRYGSAVKTGSNILSGAKTAFGRIQGEVQKFQEGQIARDRQNKAIGKIQAKKYPEKRGLGLFE